MNSLKSIIIIFNALIFCSCIYGQEPQFDISLNKLPLYNPKTLFFGSGRTITTPSGWGASNNTLFIGGGIALRQVYADDPDGGAVIGIGIGNPFRNLGIEVSTKMNDLSEQNNFSFNLKMHRAIGAGMAVAIGGDHLLFNRDESDGISSYYISLSYAFQNMPSKIPGQSKMNFNVGIGNGRFSNKSPRDIVEGKGEKGTYVFGSLAYLLFRNHSLVMEWSGTNLNLGLSSQPLRKIPIFFSLSLVDLTSNSGDGARFVIGGGIAYSIF